MLLLLQALVGLGLVSLIILHVLKHFLVGSAQAQKCGYTVYTNAVNCINAALVECAAPAQSERDTILYIDGATSEELTTGADEHKASACVPHDKQVGICLEPAVCSANVQQVHDQF